MLHGVCDFLAGRWRFECYTKLASQKSAWLPFLPSDNRSSDCWLLRNSCVCDRRPRRIICRVESCILATCGQRRRAKQCELPICNVVVDWVICLPITCETGRIPTNCREVSFSWAINMDTMSGKVTTSADCQDECAFWKGTRLSLSGKSKFA